MHVRSYNNGRASGKKYCAIRSPANRRTRSGFGIFNAAGIAMVFTGMRHFRH